MTMFSPAVTRLLAAGVLGAAALVLVVLAGRGFRRSPFGPLQTVLYWCNYVWARVLWRARISGRLPIAPHQGAVIVCNHRCPLDPSFIAMSVRRVVRWMVAKEYCENPAYAWALRACEVIPVSRGGIDTAATKTAIRYAREGGLVGLFPEGRINDTDRLLLPGRSGAALIALKARVPVVPCYVEGSPYDGTSWGCFLMPAKVHLKIGPPIDLTPYYGREDERAVLEDLTRRFLREIAGLAGRSDFQPELAGRFYKPRSVDD